MKKIIISIFILLSINAFSQIDSLERVLLTAKDTARVKLLTTLSFEYWNKSPNKGLLYGKEALSLAIKLGDETGVADAYNVIGVNEWVRGNYDLALKNYYSALKIYEKKNDNEAIVFLENNIALIYKEIGRIDDAIEHHKKAIALLQEIKIERKAIFLYVNLGVDYLQKKDYTQAQKLFDNALALCVGKENLKYLSQIQANKASIFYEHKNYPEAIKLALLALKGKSDYADSLGMVRLNNFLADIYLDLNDDKKFLLYINKARFLALKKDFKSELVDSYDMLSEYYANKKNYEEAYNYYLKRDILKDSLDSSKQIVRTNIIKEKFDNSLKEEQITDLKEDNEIHKVEISKQNGQKQILIIFSFLLFLLLLSFFYGYKNKKKKNKELNEQNDLINEQKRLLSESMADLELSILQKDKFIAIIAHDLRNPFNVIMGFSNMLKEDFDSLDDATKKEYIRSINNSSKFTYKLLEDLLLWAKSNGNFKLKYESKNLRVFIENAISPYIENAKSKNIEIRDMLESNISISLDAFTMTTIIANIISNSIKFTRHNGKICISYSSDNKYHIILIEDNGIGMSEEKVESLFKLDKNTSTDGTANEKGSGLGMLLCKEFIAKNNGELVVESKPNVGSKFFIKIPKV